MYLHADGGPLVHSHTHTPTEGNKLLGMQASARSLALANTHTLAEVEHQKGISHCKFGCGARLNCILHGYVRRILRVT